MQSGVYKFTTYLLTLTILVSATSENTARNSLMYFYYYKNGGMYHSLQPEQPEQAQEDKKDNSNNGFRLNEDERDYYMKGDKYHDVDEYNGDEGNDEDSEDGSNRDN